ncbi:MAG: hypothetical protein U9M97_03330 [Candidatus Hadarchaeota archaeon]|nr:hypothetical protein [Candidatus Hadarchaeota archaeon]
MRGQASVEMLMIIAAVLAVLAILLVRGVHSNEVSNAIAAARVGAGEAIEALALEYGADIGITGCDRDGDNIVLYLSVQGSPPPDDSTVENAVGEAALSRVRQVGGGYDVSVIVERVIK